MIFSHLHSHTCWSVHVSSPMKSRQVHSQLLRRRKGDVSAYIPTNVISITDGQIYLQSNLFFRASAQQSTMSISVSASVAMHRSGYGRLQVPFVRTLQVTVRKQAFSQFGSDLDAYQLNTRCSYDGASQAARYSALDVIDQICAIYAAKENFIDVDLKLLSSVMACSVHEWYHPQLHNSLRNGKISDEQAQSAVYIKHFKAKFLEEHPEARLWTGAEANSDTQALLTQ